MSQVGGDGIVRAAREFITATASTEIRVVLSAGVLAACVLGALVVVPYLTETGLGLVRRWLERRERTASLAAASAGLPTGLLVRGVVRGVQVALGFGALLAILLVWGEITLATSIGTAVATAAPVGAQLVATVGLGFAAYVGTDLLEAWLAEYAAATDDLNQHQEGIVFRILQLTIILGTVLGTLVIWDVNLTGLLVGAGFLGIVVGMAARQTLGSVIAGFVLMFSRPMELGDWVEIDDEEGIVTDITIVNTRLRNFDGETIVIPNDRVGNATVVNRSDQGQLRVRVDVGVDYDADLDEAESLALSAIEGVEGVANNPAPQVVPTGFGDSAVTLQCRFWIARPTIAAEVRARSAVVRAVKAAFDDAGVKIPFPQRELSGRAETGGFRVAEGESLPSRAPPEASRND